MFSRLLNGASSPANCARKIAGPLIVCISANSRNSTEHLIMFLPSVHKFSCRSHGLVLVVPTCPCELCHRGVDFSPSIRGGGYGSQCALRPDSGSLRMVAGKAF